MQDVSRVAGNPVTIESKILGKTFVLRGMTFDDLAVLQRKFLREKKQRVLEAAQLRAELEPPEARAAILDKVQAEIATVAYLSDAEFQSSLQTMQGATEFLWTLFERQFPGQVSRGDIIRMVAAREFPAASLNHLVAELIGGPPEGESTGQSKA